MKRRWSWKHHGSKYFQTEHGGRSADVEPIILPEELVPEEQVEVFTPPLPIPQVAEVRTLTLWEKIAQVFRELLLKLKGR